jgi:hypothetical protein
MVAALAVPVHREFRPDQDDERTRFRVRALDMRRFLSIFGALMLTAIVAAVIGIGVLLHNSRGLDAESKAFVDSAIPAIAATWSEQQLLERATPELRQIAKPEQLRALFERFAQLGPLVEYEGATGGSRVDYKAGSGSTVSAAYVARARFKNGSATLRLLLVKRDGRWMIHNFNVDPEPGNQPAQRA